MVSITSGYNYKCNDNLGGVKYIYLFPFVKYPRSQINITNNILNTFPTTTIYKFEFVGSPSLEISQEENDGGKFYNESISFDLLGLNDSFEIQKLIKKDYRCIIEDNNGNKRILGLYNGLELNSLNSSTGGGKSDLNGFKLSFKGQEINEPFFINDLNDAGFTISGQDLDYLLQENGDFILQEDGFKIII